MKRWIVALLAAVLAMSMGAVALADDDVETAAEDTAELNEVLLWRSENLAAYFAPRFAAEDAEPEDVETETEELAEQIIEYRTGDDRIGWGAMYKLMLLAEYHGEDLTEVADGLREEGGWGFGKAMKDLREDSDYESDTPKNFGQWKKQQRQNASGGD